MSVILEFSIDSESFQLGQVLAPPPDVHVELERIIPIEDDMMPYLWVSGDEHDAFEADVRSHRAVETFTSLDRFDTQALYRLEWKAPPSDLIEAIAESRAVVLEAEGSDEWLFKLRFPHHDRLSDFHNAIIDLAIPIHIERTYTLTEEYEHGHRLDLTANQRDALVLALQRGYFDTPSEVSLDDLADELGITRQAVSKRIRRGNEKVLRKTLLPSASDVG